MHVREKRYQKRRKLLLFTKDEIIYDMKRRDVTFRFMSIILLKYLFYLNFDRKYHQNFNVN